MRTSTHRSVCLLVLFSAACGGLAPANVQADDWPQWRGPNRDGWSADTGLLKKWPAGYQEKGRFVPPDRAKEKAWPHPTIANGQLYLRDQDLLLC